MVTVVVKMSLNSVNDQIFPMPISAFRRICDLIADFISNSHFNFRAKTESRGTERNPITADS
jgi:hypothetical protein